MRTLYHTPLSPFCRKARLMLLEKNLEAKLMLENPWEKKIGLFALNPAGDVPVLVEDDGMTISGNHAVCEYLEDKYPEPNLIGKTVDERAEVRRMVDWFDYKFDFEVTQRVLFEKVYRRLIDGSPPDSACIRRGKENITYHLDYVGYLTADKHYLCSNELSLADLAAAAHFSALDYLGDIPWEHNKTAAEWYALMKSRASMRTILEDRVCGIRPPEYYENPDF